MKLLFDLFPVILFFAAFKYAEGNKEAAASWLDGLFASMGLAGGFAADQAPVLVATVVVIVATFGQIIWVRLKHGKVDKMLWVSLILVAGLGGLTLALRDETFIKWKPTVLYWVFAAVLVGSAVFFRRNLIRSMLDAQIKLPEPQWSRLNLAWAGFFLLMGFANLFIAMNYPTDVWVNFKLFGSMGLMLVFVIAQGIWLNRYLEEPAQEENKEES